MTHDRPSASSGQPPSPTPVLLVDDEPVILAAFSRILRSAGFEVAIARDGEEALARLNERSFEVVLSDISMPGMSGLEFLKAVRRLDLDVPVILVTGGASLSSAMEAIEFGAFRYLLKPVEPAVLIDLTREASKLGRIARLKREALTLLGSSSKLLGDRAALEARLTSAISKLWLALQPVVSATSGTIVGHEAFVRSDEPTLPSPASLFEVAERVERTSELSRAIRGLAAARMSELPPNGLLFVNIHPTDLDDPEFGSATCPLTPHASRVVLELTERAALDDVSGVKARAQRLRSLGYRLAVDDLGAGYAGLTNFTQLEPDAVKLDISLVRGIDQAPSRQNIVRSLHELCGRDFGMMVVCEGVETVEERDTLLRLGCDWMQGNLFGEPRAPEASSKPTA